MRGDDQLVWQEAPNASSGAFADFLRSEDVANFDQLASEIVRSNPPFPNFVPTNAEVRDPSDEVDERELAPDALLALVDAGRIDANGETELCFVKGSPGTGKTTLLREATRRQAERYVAGESDFLLLYVTAQGRELSNLRDAFASELDDLGGPFGKRAIDPLCRRGLLVPVIDGFDELLGTAGYSGAFAALQELFDGLNGLGAVVVSARSAFYELEFVGRLDSTSSRNHVSISTVDLRPWSESQLVRFLKGTANGLTAEEIAEAFDRIDNDADKSLLTRPFFAGQFPEYLRSGADTSDSSLVDFLIASYVARESGKLTDSNGSPIMSADGHYRLLEFAAEEMWTGEKRTLPISDLEAIADLVGGEVNLTQANVEQLQRKLTSYAGFGATRTGEFQFEHEVYFEHFLGRRIGRYLSEGCFDDIDAIMAGGVLSLDSLRTTLADRLSGPLPTRLLTADNARHSENIRRNRASMVLVLAQMNSQGLNSLEVTGLAFYGLSFGGVTFRDVVFEDCEFSMCNFASTQFIDCTTLSSRFHRLQIDARSILDIDGITDASTVSMLVTETAELYDPQFIARALTNHGAPSAKSAFDMSQLSDSAQKLIRLLDRLVTAFRRTTLLFDDSDRAKRHQRKLVTNPDWSMLKHILEETGCIDVDRAFAMSGRRCDVIRLCVPAEELVQGRGLRSRNTQVAAFWEKLSSVS